VRERVANGAFPCTEKLFRLRLTRMGTTLAYAWAPGIDGNNFEEIHRADYGPEDIARVTLAVLNGRTLANVDVQFLDLHIRGQRETQAVLDPSKSPPRYKAKIAATPPPKSGGTWKALGAVAVLVGIILAGALIFFRRRDAPNKSEE
jgi:hypothetical protein